MDVKIQLLILLQVFWLFVVGGVRCFRLSRQNNIWQEDFPSGALETEFFHGPSPGFEKLPMEVFKNDEDALEEEREKESEVDEETIRKAEKMADKDLLNGLNRILKNNETLKDVFRTENVYEIP